jgi:hypothetical protein
MATKQQDQLASPWRASDKSKWYWPTIYNIDTARSAAFCGSYAAFFVSCVSAAVASLSAFHVLDWVDSWSFVDAGLFAVLGFLIRRMSRVAAASALALYLLERVYAAHLVGWTTTAVVLAAPVFTLFVSGVRGTIAHHRYKGHLAEEQTPPCRP